jgi:electron transport complex protein RnfB
MSLADRIDALLPQTQCTRCGYPTCRAYAEAVAGGKADLNQCAPGGSAGIRKLAALLERSEKPLNPAHGAERPRAAALIDEMRCIGCMLCIQACPVDAIMGAARRMHTVLTAACTGCELCVPPCPVDCIEMVELSELAARRHVAASRTLEETVEEMATIARGRFELRNQRLEREKRERNERLAGRAAGPSAPDAAARDGAQERKKALVQAALERARARREAQAQRRKHSER